MNTPEGGSLASELATDITALHKGNEDLKRSVSKIEKVLTDNQLMSGIDEDAAADIPAGGLVNVPELEKRVEILEKKAAPEVTKAEWDDLKRDVLNTGSSLEMLVKRVTALEGHHGG